MTPPTITAAEISERITIALATGTAKPAAIDRAIKALASMMNAAAYTAPRFLN